MFLDNALCNHAQLTRFLTFRSGRYFDSTLSHLAWSFSLQSIIKHLLTEGDKIVLVGSSTAEDMGVYAYVSNYGNSFAYQTISFNSFTKITRTAGSLAARIVFQPVEETMRAYFSKVLNASKITRGTRAKDCSVIFKSSFLPGTNEKQRHGR